MDFKYFVDNKKVIRGNEDHQKSEALKRMSSENLESVRRLPLDESNASIILVMGYESLRQILEAMALRKGYKVYSHEAYTYYLIEMGENAAAAKFDRLRRLRNGVNYYGRPVNKDTAANALEEVARLIRSLKGKYLGHDV